MKRVLLFLLSMFFLAGCAGQFQNLEETASGAPPGGTRVSGNIVTTLGQKAFLLPRSTVANLPTLATSDAGALWQVTDGADSEDTTVGGGSDTVLARWTGSAWTNAGDGTAVGSAEVQDEAFNSTNFDGDTSHGASQDDFYDLWHGVDADDDGSFADESWLSEISQIFGTTYYASDAGIPSDPFPHSLASVAYVNSRDTSAVSNGMLTHIDSDDQGDNARVVWGDGRFIYLANNDGGLHTYSVSSSGTLTHIDSDDQGDNAREVWGDGRFIYLANNTGGLHTYSVSDSGILTHIDSDDQGDNAYGVWGDGRFIYLANYTGGLHTYSVDNAGTLTHIDSDDQGDNALGVWGDGRFIYLANNTGGLHTYSVSSSGTLTHIDSDDQGDTARVVWGDGRFIYLANNDGGLHTYSVSDSGILTHIDSDDQGDNAYGVWGDGRFIYLANYAGGLHTYSVDNAGTLTHIDSDDQGDNAIGVWGDGRFIYLANNTGGLHTYSVDNAYEYNKGTQAHTFTGAMTATTVSDGTVTLAGDGTITGLAEGWLTDNTIVEADLKVVDSPSDEDIFTYESTTGEFEWHSATEVKAAMSLDSVENTALSTWAGSANITTLGTIGTGTWQGTAIAKGYVATDLDQSNLAATITFADGDFLDFSNVDYTGGGDAEGIALPTYVAATTPTGTVPYMAYDASNNRIMVWESGGWADTSSGTGAPAAANYVVTASDGTLTDESVLTAGYGIDVTDAGGDGGAVTVAMDTTEISADGSDTWSDGSQASIVWTFDVTGTDHTMTFDDGLVTFGDAVTVTDALTINGNITDGTATWNSTTQVLSGFGNITSTGTVEGATLTEGGVAVWNDNDTDIVDDTHVNWASMTYLGEEGQPTAAAVGLASANLDDTDASIEWEDAADLESDGSLSADVVAAAEMADADHGMVSWSSGVATVEDFALNDDASVIDHIAIVFGSDSDWNIEYDETTDDRLELTHAAGAGADVYWDLNDNAADSNFVITNSDGTYDVNVEIDGDLYLQNGSVVRIDSTTVDHSLDFQAYDTDGSVWTTVFSIVNGTDPGIEMGNLHFADSDTSPDSTGELVYDNTVTGIDDGALCWYDDDEIKYIASYETLPVNDGYQLTYNSSTDKIYWAAAGGAGSTAWDDITDPDNAAAKTITFDNGEYTIITSDFDGGDILILQLSDTDQAADSTILKLQSADTDDDNTIYLEAVADYDGTPDVVWELSGDGNVIQDGNITAGGNLATGGAALSSGDIYHRLGDAAGSDVFVIEDSGGTDQFTVDSDGGITVITGGTLTFGSTQWDNGSDAIDGEVIADDTIDDDSLDFADITLDDFVSAEGDYISVATDDTFDFTRNDAGTVTITASDDDATAALTVLPGGAAALTLGGGSTTAITLTTDSTGDAEVVLPDDSIGPAEMASGAYDLGTSLEADTLTEGGNAVYNSSETPGGELGGTWASPTIDDTGITLVSLTVGALLGVNTIDTTGAQDMVYGSADVAYHQFIADGGTSIIDGSFKFPDADGSPSAVGELQYDNTITGLDDGALAWYDDDDVQIVISISATDFGSGPTDDYVVAYDADADKWYAKPALAGETTIGDPGGILLSDDNYVELDATADGMDDDEYNGVVIGGRNCGEGLTQWDTVRLANDSDPWHQADANAAGEFPAHGLSVAACTDTNEARILVRGIVRNEGWTGLTPGGAVYLSETAGGITQTAPSDSGDCVQIVGWALSDSEIYFDFSRPYLEVE